MKQHEADAPVPSKRATGPLARPPGPNALRRALMLALPGTVLFAPPLVLIGCGGTGDGTAAEPGDPLLALPPGEVTSSAMAVTIDMPAALPAAAFVVSASGAVAVNANQAMVEVFADGPQLATVFAADGTPLLMGWVGKNRPALSAHSTATVLLHFGLGLPFFGPDARDTLRQRLEAHVATAAFGGQIAAILAADPKALANGSAALIDAFGQAAQQLLPPAAATAAKTRERPLGLTVEPAGFLSGLQVAQGDTLNSCFVDNIYVRRAVVVVNREAWVDSSGQRQVEPQAPVQIGEVMELPLPTTIDSVSNVVAGWANQYFTPDDPNSFFRSVSDTVTLDIAPDGAKRTEYSVVVLMAGALLPDASTFDRLPASQKAYVRGLDITKHLGFRSLLIDLIGPFFFEMLAQKLGESAKGKSASAARKDLMENFASTLFGILQNQVPDVIQKLSDGSTDAWTAFKTIGKALTFDPDTGAMSPLLKECLSQLAVFCAARLADAKLRSPLLEVASGLKVGGKGVLGILPVLRIITEFDKWLGRLAAVRIVADLGRSRQMESWKVNAGKAKVVLRPDPIEVETTGVTYPVTVEIVDNDNDDYGVEKGSIDFDWDCSGLYGTLYSRADTGLSKPNRFTTSKNFATTDYLPNGKEPDPAAAETISVRAYFQPIGSAGTRQLIGSATSTLKFKKAFSLRITPATMELPTDEKLSLVATMNEAVPKTASVRFEWKLRSGGGDLNIPFGDGDTVNSQVDYLAPAGETTAVIEVVAVVTVDPALPPTRTDAVTSTIKVKKGLRQIVMEVGGGVFGCTDPLACGVTEYTAFIVPRLSKAISYTAVLSGYAYGPCNRSVTWNSVKGDGGGCNFPVSYHPHSSAGATNLWAVWIGFGGPFGGKCVVTITLAP